MGSSVLTLAALFPQALRPTQATVQLDQEIIANASANGAADAKAYDMSKVRKICMAFAFFSQLPYLMVINR